MWSESSGALSRHNLMIRLYCREVESRHEQNIFSSPEDLLWGPPLSLIFHGYRIYFPGAKWSERDADHSPPFSAVVTNGWSCTSVCLRGVCRDNLRFTVGPILTKFCVRPFLVLRSPHFPPCIKRYRHHDELHVETGTTVNAVLAACSRYFQEGKPRRVTFMHRISLFLVSCVSRLRW